MKVGDKVTITNAKMKALYGIKDTDEFEITELCLGDKFLLKNGWMLRTKHVKEVNPQHFPNVNLMDLLQDERTVKISLEQEIFPELKATNGIVIRAAASSTANLEEWQDERGKLVIKAATNQSANLLEINGPLYEVVSEPNSWSIDLVNTEDKPVLRKTVFRKFLSIFGR